MYEQFYGGKKKKNKCQFHSGQNIDAIVAKSNESYQQQ